MERLTHLVEIDLRQESDLVLHLTEWDGSVVEFAVRAAGGGGQPTARAFLAELHAETREKVHRVRDAARGVDVMVADGREQLPAEPQPGGVWERPA